MPRDLYDGMIRQALTERPNECCGFLAGRLTGPDGAGGCHGRAVQRYPLVNTAPEPRTEYFAEGKELLQHCREMRQHGLEILAIYHSHPTSAPRPSRKDLERNFYGSEVMHFIISLQGEAPEVRAWWLDADAYREAEWDCVAD